MSRSKPQPEWRLGSLSPSKPGKHYILPPQFFPIPDRFNNASMREPLDMSRMWTAPHRPGSDHDHPSHGIGC